VVGNKDFTLEALAEQLELRVNTLWGFKHKVAERIAELERTGKKPHASRWEEVILITEGHPKVSKKGSGSRLPDRQPAH
jgi:hypothetical protein